MGIAYVPGLTWFAALFLMGVVISLFAQKIRIPDIILLLLTGIIFSLKGYSIEQFIPNNYLLGFTVFALILIVFDSASSLKLSELMDISPIAIKLSVIFLLLNVLILTFFTQLIFFDINDFSTIYIAVVFSCIMAGTSPEVLAGFLGSFKSKILDILNIESVINDPITLVIPLIIFNIYTGALATNSIINSFLIQIGLGLLIGIFVLTEALNGDGILAVTSLAIMFANAPIREKFELQKFSTLFANFLRVVLFILLGLLIKINFDLKFFIDSFALFLILLAVRFLSVQISTSKSGFTFKEKVFMTLNVPKGITTAILLLILGQLFLAEELILKLGLMFII